MKLTNPPILRGLGRTASVNRRGLLLKEPTTQGLAQTATPAARDATDGGRTNKVTQLVSATDNSVLVDADETDLVSVSINRKGGSELDINASVVVPGIPGDEGAGPPYAAALSVYRDSTLLQILGLGSGGVFLHAVDHEAAAVDQVFAGVLFFGLVDDDYVSGVVTYKTTIELFDSVGASVGGGLILVNDAYLRVLERRL